MRLVWLALALWGTVHPMSWFLPWLAANDWSIMGMVEAWHANGASSGLVWDLTIAAVTLTLWVIWESAKTGNWRGLWAVPATYLIGVSCGLPLYLALRPQARQG